MPQQAQNKHRARTKACDNVLVPASRPSGAGRPTALKINSNYRKRSTLPAKWLKPEIGQESNGHNCRPNVNQYNPFNSSDAGYWILRRQSKTKVLIKASESAVFPGHLPQASHLACKIQAVSNLYTPNWKKFTRMVTPFHRRWDGSFGRNPFKLLQSKMGLGEGKKVLSGNVLLLATEDTTSRSPLWTWPHLNSFSILPTYYIMRLLGSIALNSIITDV